MKKFLGSVTFLVLCASTAFADISFTVVGKIVDIQPVFTRVNQQVPQQQCHNENRVISHGGSGANTAAGAVIGGVIGNQFGGGDGKTAMTILGAILGADTANRNAGQKRVEQVTVCDTVYVNQSGNVVNEYDIIYEVNGQYITSRVNSAQGERARVGRSQSFRVTYQPVN
jgi:uncharacterized protein YcfJ|tara:strand:- start:928 stop:1437 length:510 start_codon:yes stop_codon:yes gene_type:complete